MGTSNYQSKKVRHGAEFSWNFPRLFKYAGVLVPLGAVAGCNFLLVHVLRYWGLGFSCFIRPPYYTGR